MNTRYLGFVAILLLVASSFVIVQFLPVDSSSNASRTNSNAQSIATATVESSKSVGSLSVNSTLPSLSAIATKGTGPVNIVNKSVLPPRIIRNLSDYYLPSRELTKSVFNNSSVGVIIPLYTQPTDNSWQAVISAKKSNPNISMLAVINPNNGPGNGFSESVASGIQQLRAAGIEVAGYVATGYGRNSLGAVQLQIHDYSSWYKLDGIFFDEMASTNGTGNCASACTLYQYYSQLASYASKIGYNVTIGNPGQNTVENLKSIMKVTIIYESTGNAPISTIKSSTAGFDRSRFAYIAIGVGLNSTLTQSFSHYVGWIYTTDLCTGQSVSACNPYSGLPSYFPKLVSGLDR